MALTKDQRTAVRSIGKNILVSAGAGTGKTRVLVERILHLLCAQKAALTELLVLTFTEKAAHEIKKRLSGSFRELGLEQPRRDLEKAVISTFHGFAARLLKEHPVEAGVHLPETCVHPVETCIHLLETRVHAVETGVHLLETGVHLLREAAVGELDVLTLLDEVISDFFEAPVD